MHIRELREISVSELDKYIIIDTHGGVEDILGITIALKLAQRYDKIVLGITCVNGRRTLDQAAHDALIAQQIAGTSVPVFLGSKQSLLLKSEYPKCYHLLDHSEELDILPVPTELQALVQKQPAQNFIAEQITKYSDQLCIITFGPLTNLALAYHRTQNIKTLSSIRINGGTFSGVGNVISSPASEGNFYYDAEAVHIAITNYINIYVNPIENTLETSWAAFFQELQRTNLSRNNPVFDKILEIILSNKQVLCGPLLTLMPAFQRHTLQKVFNVYSEVILQGKSMVGLLAPNWLRLQVLENQQAPNTKIYSLIDREEIQKVIKLALFN